MAWREWERRIDCAGRSCWRCQPVPLAEYEFPDSLVHGTISPLLAGRYGSTCDHHRAQRLGVPSVHAIESAGWGQCSPGVAELVLSTMVQGSADGLQGSADGVQGLVDEVQGTAHGNSMVHMTDRPYYQPAMQLLRVDGESLDVNQRAALTMARDSLAEVL
jgi:hypothetical protein